MKGILCRIQLQHSKFDWSLTDKDISKSVKFFKKKSRLREPFLQWRSWDTDKQTSEMDSPCKKTPSHLPKFFEIPPFWPKVAENRRNLQKLAETRKKVTKRITGRILRDLYVKKVWP